MGFECSTESASWGTLREEVSLKENQEEKSMERSVAIVLAAGQGSRMGGSVKKQFLRIGSYPVLYYSLQCFQNSEDIQEIILVTGEDSITYCQKEIVDLYGFTKVTRIIPGGKERYDSVYAGLLACKECDYVFIHDGARPFISEEIIKRGLDGAKKTGACVVGMPSKDTVKLADENGYVKETPARNLVWTVQTPQVFRYSLIRKAYESMQSKDMTAVTDDACVVEQETGVKIWLAEGSYKNIKITTPEDLLIAKAFLEEEAD